MRTRERGPHEQPTTSESRESGADSVGPGAAPSVVRSFAHQRNHAHVRPPASRGSVRSSSFCGGKFRNAVFMLLAVCATAHKLPEGGMADMALDDEVRKWVPLAFCLAFCLSRMVQRRHPAHGLYGGTRCWARFADPFAARACFTDDIWELQQRNADGSCPLSVCPSPS